MRGGRQSYQDGIASLYEAAGYHNPHDTCLQHQAALGISVDEGPHQALLESVELDARIAKTGNFNHGVVAEEKPGAAGKSKQVNPKRRDILADVPCSEQKACRGKLGEQFRCDEVDLPQIGLRWVGLDAGAVPDLGACVAISVDANSGDELDFRHNRLGKTVRAGSRDRQDLADARHQ